MNGLSVILSYVIFLLVLLAIFFGVYLSSTPNHNGTMTNMAGLTVAVSASDFNDLKTKNVNIKMISNSELNQGNTNNPSFVLLKLSYGNGLIHLVGDNTVALNYVPTTSPGLGLIDNVMIGPSNGTKWSTLDSHWFTSDKLLTGFSYGLFLSKAEDIAGPKDIYAKWAFN